MKHVRSFSKMRSEEELKTMIRCFRAHDLQMLLAFAGISKVGKKQELRDRALRLLKLKSRSIGLKIKQIYNSMQRGYKNKNAPSGNSEIIDSTLIENDNGGGSEKGDDCVSIVEENDDHEKNSLNIKLQLNDRYKPKENFQMCSLQPNSSAQISVNSLYYPIHPDVKFETLPFYKVLYELMRPSSLVPENYQLEQKNCFIFYLTPQQAAAISLSKDTRPGTQHEYTVQCQLRFCLLETTSQQEDSFPPSLVVKVNNKFCSIQETQPRKKKDIYAKESSPPINITPLMKINPAEGNKVEVFWNTEYGRAYAVGIFLVQKKSSEDLLNRLKAKGIRGADYTKGMIKDKLNEEADGEIVTTSLRVSLMCPLGKMKLRTPCRASTCEHLQCFDASLFLQMNERKPTWMCPVCDNPAKYDKLVIDGYFQELLSSDKLPPEINEIELHNDGSWSSLTLKTEENSSGDGSIAVKIETEEIVEILEDEDEVKCSTSSTFEGVVGSSNTNQFQTELTGTEKRQVDEVDLTISDSDDEPLIWYKRRKSQNAKSNTDVQASNENPNPKTNSVIDLDSDSSDSLSLMISAQFPLLPPIL